MMKKVDNQKLIDEKHSDNTFLSVFENSLSSVLLENSDGGVLEANTAALEMFGYSLEEMRASGRQILFDHTDPVMIEALKTREKEKKIKCELIGIRKNGERFPCEVSSAIFKIENGELRTSTVLNDISRRKKADEAMELLINNTEESFVLIDKSLHIVSFNKSFSDRYKLYLNIEVKKGDFILDYPMPDRKKIVESIFTRVLSGEQVIDEVKRIAPDTSEHIFAAYYKPAVDYKKEIIGAFITIRDVTQQKKAQQLLIANELRFRSILEHSGDLISLVDAKGKFIYISPSLEKFLGVKKEEVVNKYYKFIIHTDDREESKLILQKLLKNPGIPIPRKVRFLNKHGNSIWVEGVITNLLHDDNVKAIVSNYRDISEKINNTILQEFEKRNQEALINSTNDLIWSVSDDLKLITGNKAFIETLQKMIGIKIMPGDDILIPDFFDEEYVAFWKSKYARALSGESFKEEMISINKVDNSKTWNEISFNPIVHNNSNVIGVACDSRDVTEMKLAYEKLKLNEENLKQKHEQLLKLTDNVDAIIYQFQITRDGQMSFPFMSKSIYRLAPDIDIESLKDDGSIIFGSVYPADVPQLLSSIEESKINLTDWNLEYRNISKDNKVKWIKGSSRPYKKEDGTVVWYGYLLDVTERRLNYEKIKKAQEQYDIISKATNDTIRDWDLISNRINWSTGISRIYGYNQHNEDLDIEWWYNKIHPKDLSRIKESILSKIKKNETRWEEEYRFRCFSGNYAHVLERFFLVLNVHNEPIRIISAMQDVTVQKREEHRLKLMESVITSTTDAVMITETEPFDEPGPKILYVNEAFTRMTGYSLSDVFGKSPRILQGPKTDQLELRKLSKAMRKWKSCEITIINYKKNGEEFWINFSVTPVADEDGWYTHWIAIQRDVTSIKLNELEKEQIISELSQNNNDLKQFSYVTSHNLRAPIAHLLGLTSLIDHDNIQDKSLVKILEGIRQSALNFDDTVKDLAKVLIIKDQTSISKKRIYLLTVLDKVIKQLDLKYNRDLDIVYDFGIEPVVQFTNAYMESILLNLFTNALKYKSFARKLAIRISLHKEENFIVLKFSDNGIGIDTEKYKDKLFKLYQRFHNQSEGKGLGLYLIKTQLDALGGTIEIESKIDVGTTFIIKFRNT